MFYVIKGFRISYEGKSLKVGIFDREVVLKHGGVVKNTHWISVPYYNAYKFLKTLFQLYLSVTLLPLPTNPIL